VNHTAPTIPPIESALDRAAAGDVAAGRLFLQLFLTTPLVVPNRRQTVPMGGLATYPSELISLLALDDGGRSLVPVFSQETFVSDWCGRDLQTRTLTGSELLAILPDTWWVGVNLGREASKELSPWELNLLKTNRPDALDEIIREIFSISEDDLPDYEPFDEKHSPDLTAALAAYAQSEPDIVAITLVREVIVRNGSRQVNRLLVGFSAPRASASARAQLQDSLSRRAALYQIGGDPAHVVCQESFEGGLFAKPLAVGTRVYQRRPRSLLEVIRDSLGFSG